MIRRSVTIAPKGGRCSSGRYNAYVMGSADELQELISAAFPAQRFYGPVTDGCKCDECAELAASLRHKSWDEIDDETMDAQFGSLPLLASDAFWAFLPAWLMRSLEALDADQHKIREWTLYALALYHDNEYDDADELPDKTNRLRWQYERLTPEQARAIEQFLLLIRDHAPISLRDKESIERALPLLRKP